MNGLRNSIFNKALTKFEKNKFTKEMIYFVIKIGLGDYIYRTFSKGFLENRREFYKQNEKRIRKNISILDDDISKEIYQNLIKYRCFRKRNDFPKVNKEPAYFDKDIIDLSENEVFIDCGAFIGDTTEIFLEKVENKYRKIACFEPDKTNFEILKENIKDHENIVSYCYGVYSKNGTLRFNSKQNDGSVLDKNGEETVEVVSLDELEECKDASFIKMDIEGAELEALKGAKQIILKNRPKLAICIYHSDQDMIDIIEYVNKLNLNYKLYVRHYSLYEAETILYCV